MSAILKNWNAGLGLPGVLVIDGHIHINGLPTSAIFDDVDQAVRGSVAWLDAHGVDAACVLSGGYMWEGSDHRLGNDLLIEYWRRLPERVIPFCHVNPNDDRRSILAELERMFAAGVRALKLLNSYQHYPGDGPNLMAVYEFASGHNMLVLNHAWEADVLWKLSALHPGVNFICAHYGGGLDPILKERPNVYANIWGYGPMGWLDRGIAGVGAGKFILGSDGFVNPLSVGIGPVVHAPISDDDKRLILGLTMARLLDGVGALPEPVKRKCAPPLR